MDTVTLELIIENSGNELTGRVTYNDNLIVDTDKSLSGLEEKIKNLLADFEGLNPASIQFTHAYDVYALFEQFDFLKISKVAEHAGMHAGLLRQYASQVKFPSANQAKKIETALHDLARQMMQVSVYVHS